MVRKLAIRSLRRGIGSMDYIDILLIMEDDLDDEVESLGEFGQSSHSENPFNPDEPSEPTEQSTPTIPNPSQDTSCRPVPDWSNSFPQVDQFI
jgi:hypothetical protein